MDREETFHATRKDLLEAGLKAFERTGYERATVATIRAIAGVSNGSFFHFFKSKEALAAALYLDALQSYHDAMARSVSERTSAAEGVANLVKAHLRWVTDHRAQARFLFEQSRSEWLEPVRDQQRAANASFKKSMHRWIEPRVEDGTLYALPPTMLIAQIIGPAQIFCRAWLSGRVSEHPARHAKVLVNCARRAVVRSTSALQ
jgi:AcrR family transcriptional regulator